MTDSDDKKWTTLESRYVVRRPWLTARCERVQLPTGAVHDEYYVLEYPTWVNIIARDENGRFIMVEQYRHGLGEVFTELCAGIAEEGEDPETAARRELAEETGYTGGRWRLLSVISANPSTQTNLTYCFVAEGVRKTQSQQLDSTEDLSVKLLTQEDIAGMLARDEIKQSLMATPLLKYLFETQLQQLADGESTSSKSSK
jgi:8-oxo-dGTP pyrophosphatase MutT (NUDIX family)